jgi:hypothetical protein
VQEPPELPIVTATSTPEQAAEALLDQLRWMGILS